VPVIVTCDEERHREKCLPTVPLATIWRGPLVGHAALSVLVRASLLAVVAP
jgi:hypothetical protein